MKHARNYLHIGVFVAMVFVFLGTYLLISSSEGLMGSISSRSTAYEQNFCRPAGERQEVCIPGSIPSETVFIRSSRKLIQTPSDQNNNTACLLMTETDAECESVILEARDTAK